MGTAGFGARPGVEYSPETSVEREHVSLVRLLLLFLKVGCLAFGGGMAIVAYMEQELAVKRRVLPISEFMHGVALGQVLGPYAANTCFFVGYRLFGVMGGVLCVTAFVLPSLVLVVFLSWIYFSYHALPALQGVIAGLQPAVIALIVSAAWSMGRKAVRSWPAAVICAAGLLSGMGKVNPIYVLAGGGLVGLLLGGRRVNGMGEPQQPASPNAGIPSKHLSGGFLWGVPSTISVCAGAVTLSAIAITFLKVGMMWFGGAYTIIPLLNQRLVIELKWLTPAMFRDGVAIAGITPGPLSILATFAGYHLHGICGAVVASVALYVPSTLLMMFLCFNYGRLNMRGRVREFLNGINSCVVGLVLSAAVLLSRGVIVSVASWLVALVCFVLLTKYKWAPGWVLGLSAAVGWLIVS